MCDLSTHCTQPHSQSAPSPIPRLSSQCNRTWSSDDRGKQDARRARLSCIMAEDCHPQTVISSDLTAAAHHTVLKCVVSIVSIPGGKFFVTGGTDRIIRVYVCIPGPPTLHAELTGHTVGEPTLWQNQSLKSLIHFSTKCLRCGIGTVCVWCGNCIEWGLCMM